MRQCLKEPYREKALSKDSVHMVEKIWVNGSIQAKALINDVTKSFEVGGVGSEAKK